jgi:prepilin-type N-terminal cleavage/methylation domain-containing protein
MRRGFSILEVLAATVVLGLLAVSVVPLTRRLVSDDGRLQDHVAAAERLQRIDQQTAPRPGLASPLEDHPGWWLRADRLTPLVPPTQPGQPELRPPYGWLRLVIVDGPGTEAQILAERVLVIDGGGL